MDSCPNWHKEGIFHPHNKLCPMTTLINLSLPLEYYAEGKNLAQAYTSSKDKPYGLTDGCGMV